jgi:hypothetical protein
VDGAQELVGLAGVAVVLGRLDAPIRLLERNVAELERLLVRDLLECLLEAVRGELHVGRFDAAKDGHVVFFL